MSIENVRTVFTGRVVVVNVETVRLPNGHVAELEIIHHPGGAAIVAIDEHRRACLIRQYRHAAGQYMWEVPAGRREPGEVPLPGAKRELLEETGYRAKKWTKMVRFYASPGFLGEWMQIYLAEGLSSGESEPDDDEYIEHRQIPLSQAIQWIESGKITDAKSIIAILLYERQRSAKRQMRGPAS